MVGITIWGNIPKIYLHLEDIQEYHFRHIGGLVAVASIIGTTRQVDLVDLGFPTLSSQKEHTCKLLSYSSAQT